MCLKSKFEYYITSWTRQQYVVSGENILVDRKHERWASYDMEDGRLP